MAGAIYGQVNRKKYLKQHDIPDSSGRETKLRVLTWLGHGRTACLLSYSLGLMIVSSEGKGVGKLSHNLSPRAVISSRSGPLLRFECEMSPLDSYVWTSHPNW